MFTYLFFNEILISCINYFRFNKFAGGGIAPITPSLPQIRYWGDKRPSNVSDPLPIRDPRVRTLLLRRRFEARCTSSAVITSRSLVSITGWARGCKWGYFWSTTSASRGSKTDFDRWPWCARPIVSRFIFRIFDFFLTTVHRVEGGHVAENDNAANVSPFSAWWLMVTNTCTCTWWPLRAIILLTSLRNRSSNLRWTE